MDYYEYIEQYLDGSLDAELMDKMKMAISQDADLKLAIDNFADATKLSEGFLEFDIKETIQQLEGVSKKNIKSKQPQKAKVKKLNISRWLAAAASVAIVLGVGWWMMQDDGPPLSKDEIWAQYYQAPMIDIERSGGGEMSIYDQAKYALSVEDYKESEKLFKQTLRGLPTGDTISTAQYYLGHLKLQTSNYRKAIEYFGVSNAKKAKYFLALSYYMNDQVESAKITLQSAHSDEAKDLLDDID